MHFYEPGPYDDFVGKLSSISVRPKPSVWFDIGKKLDEIEAKKSKILYWRVSSAAAIFLLLFSLGTSYLLYNYDVSNNPAFTEFANLPPSLNYNYPTLQDSDFTALLKVPLIERHFDKKADIIVTEIINEEFPRNNDLYFDRLIPIGTKFESINFANSDISNSGIFINNKIEKAAKKSFNGSWSISGYVNPYYSYHTSAAMNRTLNPREAGLWMWGGEIQIKRQISKYISILSGFHINPTGQNISDLILLQSGNISKNFEYLYANTSYGQVKLESFRMGISNITDLANAPEDVLKSSSFTTAELNQRFYHLEVPILIAMRIPVKYVNVELKFGGATGVLISNKFEVYSSRGDFIGKTEGLRNHSLAALGALSVEVPFGNQVSLIVEPYLRLGLLSINPQNRDSYPFNTAIRFGIGYKF